MHVTLGGYGLVQAIQSLCLGKRCQCGHVADLCLSSGEHGRTVYSRDNIDLSCQRTDLVDGSSIRALVVFQNHLADGLLLVLVNSLIQNGQPLFVISKSLCQPILDGADVGLTNLLHICEYSLFHLLGGYDLTDGCKQLFRNRAAGIAVLLFAALGNDLVNNLDDLLIQRMTCKNGFDHLCLRHFVGACLDHDHFLTGRCNGQMQIGQFVLRIAGIEYKLTVDHAHLTHGAGAVKRDVRDCSCNGRAKHGNNLRCALRIYRHDQIVQCHVITIILREQRTHGTVDDTGCQDRMLGCLALSLVETSGDLSRSV